jgi:hypothetical protein
VTTAVQNWITRTIKTNANAKTFAYVAHEAVHGPLEVPMRFIKGKCEELVPADYPSRLIYCGMVRAVDESVLNVTKTYKQLGLWERTLFILSADNGGNPGDGGNNYPLRGNKATVWEGGVRGLGFISGAGLAPSMRGTISHDIVHVTDWLPTLVAGVAGLPLDNETLGRPCIACDRAVAPLDGANQWPMFSSGAASARTEVLLDLQATVCWNGAHTSCDVPGMGVLRIGKWKLVHGHTAVWSKATESADQCVARSGTAAPKSTIPITANTSAPWCPNGWIPPPSTTDYQLPQPPTDAGCPSGKLPCKFPATSRYLVGSTFLFDVVLDPFEHHDVAAENPAVVAKLMQRLQQFNSSHCGGMVVAAASLTPRRGQRASLRRRLLEMLGCPGVAISNHLSVTRIALPQGPHLPQNRLRGSTLTWTPRTLTSALSARLPLLFRAGVGTGTGLVGVSCR